MTQHNNKNNFIYTRNLYNTLLYFINNQSYSVPCFVAFLNVIITYCSVLYGYDFYNNIIYFALLLNIILFLIFSYIIIRDIYQIRRESKKTHYGSRFRYRLMLLFTIAAILPVLLLGLFSSIAFRNAAKGWFDTKVEIAVTNAENVAEEYLKEHIRNIRADIFATQTDLEKALVAEKNPDIVWQHLKTQLLLRDLSAIRIFNQEGKQSIYIQSTYHTQKSDMVMTLTPPQIAYIHRHEPFIKIDRKNRHLNAFKTITLNNHLYILNITRPVNNKAITYHEETQKAVYGYNRIKQERRKSELGFALIYISFGMMIIVFMFKAGQYFALEMTIPLEMLTLTAQKIEAGDNNARCPTPVKVRDEIDRLAVAFNQMIDTLSHERKFTDAVLKGVSCGVICLDEAYHIRLINKRALDMFKMPHDTNPKSLSDLSVDFHDFSELLTALDSLKTSQKYHKLYTLMGGDKVHLHIRYRIHDDPLNTIRYIITIDDISELMRAQSAAAWQDIAQRIAHEIKNPLMPISLATEHIERKWKKEIQTSPELFCDTLNIIQKQVSHIRDTANSLAEFAKMPTPVFTRINLSDIINETIRLESLRDDTIEFIFDSDDSVCVSGDSRLLSQALINLFKNASEAIRENHILKGKIDISIECIEAKIILKIRDNGGGLPKDIAPHELFNPYVSTKDNGTGIGLAITAKIISDHNGHIILQNYTDMQTNISVGTEVIIHLPLEIITN